MAYTLQSSGLALNLLTLSGIDDDLTTFKDFVPGNTAVLNPLIDAPRIGSSTWKGNPRGWFKTDHASGNPFAPQGVTWASGPTLPMGSGGTGIGFFAILNSLGSSSSNIWSDTSGNFGSIIGGSVQQRLFEGGTTQTLATTSLPSATKFFIAVNQKYGTSTTIEESYFYGLESGSLATDGSYTEGGFGSNCTLGMYGGLAGNGSFDGQHFATGIFNRPLTLLEWQFVFADWAAALLVSGGGGETINQSDIGSRRNRPGRGPYSLGNYFRPSINAYGASPQVYAVSLAEAVSAADALSSAFTMGGTLSETVSAADLLNSLAVYIASQTEAATATDAITGLEIIAGAISESGSAADTVTSLVTAAQNLSEAASVADLLSSLMTQLSALTESVTATDDVSAGATSYSASLSEDAAASDAISSLQIAVTANSEAVTAADAVSSVQVAVNSQTESMTAADAVSAIGSFAEALSEAVTSTDSLSSTGAVYSLSIAETETLSDLLSSAFIAAGVLAETVTATDALSSIANLNGLLADAVSAIDAISFSGNISVSIVEAVNAADVISLLTANLPPRTRVFAVPLRDRVIVIQTQAPTIN